MKISIQTGGTIERLGIEAGIEAIAKAGFEAIDLGMSDGYKWEDLVKGIKSDYYNDENIYPLLDRIKAAVDKHGLEIGQAHAPAPLFVKDSPQGEQNIRADVRRCIELCEYIGCKRLIVHPIFDGSARYPSMTKAEEYRVNVEFFASLIPLLKKHGVICCLENMWIQDWKSKKIYTGICSDLNETIKYIDDLNAIAGEKLFGFCLDIGHLLLLGQDPCYWIEKLGSRLEALHMHDNDGVGDDHTIPYIGVCIWDRVVKGLRKNGFDGNLNFETAGFNNRFPSELITSALVFQGEIAKHLRNKVKNTEE